MKILFLSSWFPYPPLNGAKIRIYNLIRELANHHDITLMSFAQTISIDEAKENISHLNQYCRSVNVVSSRSYRRDSLAALVGFFSPMPRSVFQTYSPQMEELIGEKLKSESFDVIVASEVNAPTITSLLASRIQGPLKILDALEVGLAKNDFYLERSRLQRIRRGMTWYKLRRFTKGLLNNFNACTVPSVQEKQNIEEFVSDHTLVEIIPHCVDLNHYQGSFGFPEKGTLIFTGSFTYGANSDAAAYFFEQIYPRVKAEISGVRTKIVGSTNGTDVNKWPIDDHVTFTGLLSDVRPAIAQSWLSIVPLRVGAGTRLKIIESMALGTPVVSTSIGAEGLDVVHGENILLADDPKDFAQAVLEILQNPQLRDKLSAAGLKLVKERYGAETLGNKFNSLLDRVASRSQFVTPDSL